MLYRTVDDIIESALCTTKDKVKLIAQKRLKYLKKVKNRKKLNKKK